MPLLTEKGPANLGSGPYVSARCLFHSLLCLPVSCRVFPVTIH